MHQNYWKRTDPDSALYLTGPAATQRLDQDVASCTHAVDDMNKLDAMRETMPPDTAGSSGKMGVLTYYDSPTRVGEEKVSQTDFHDFEGCMRAEGWERQDYVRPQTVQTANNNYQDLQSVRQTGLTVGEKQGADAEALAARQAAVVAPGGHFTIGVEGYRDRYREPDPGVDTNTDYSGITAGYLSRDTQHYFWNVEGRVAYGKSDYSSPSGTLDGVPDYEGELRGTGGRDYPWGDTWISPYAGLGLRIFRDNGNGFFTNLGAFAYDRRIEQLYLPIGATWRALLFGRLTMANTLEVDPLLIGDVDSRLQNDGGPNVANTQGPLSGYGVRGEMMFGLPVEASTFEFGPFFRYWNVSDSTLNIQSCNGSTCLGFEEPYNTRLQVGLKARLSF